jgi:hypothetical protein
VTLCRALNLDNVLRALAVVGTLLLAYTLATRPGPRPCEPLPPNEELRNPLPEK